MRRKVGNDGYFVSFADVMEEFASHFWRRGCRIVGQKLLSEIDEQGHKLGTELLRHLSVCPSIPEQSVQARSTAAFLKKQ